MYIFPYEEVIGSIQINCYYWLIMCFSVISLSLETGLFNGLMTFMITVCFGWMIHYISHSFSYTENYHLFKQKLKIKIPEFVDKQVLMFLKYIVDFHDLIHHDSLVNKTLDNIILECFGNMVWQGLIIICVGYIMGIQLNWKVVMMWALTYTSSHNINYTLIESETHIAHHENPKTNYGIDIMDIIMKTKTCELEDHNHMAINIFLSTLVLL